MSKTILARLIVLLTISVITVMTTNIVCAETTISAITIADAYSPDSYINTVTSDDLFVRILISPNTIILQDDKTIAFDQLKRNYKITSKGDWDINDQHAFNAINILVSNTVTQFDAMDRVGAACQKITNKSLSIASSTTRTSSKMDFYIAVTKNDVQTAKRLLKNAPELLNAQDETTNNSLPLYKAATNGNTDMVEFLIENGADVNATDDDGSTALSSAVMGGYEETVRCLLEHKANVNIKDKSGITPLDCLKQNNAVIGYLLKKHGAINGVFKSSTPPSD